MDADLVLSSRSVDNVAVHSKRMTWRSLSGVDCRHICPPRARVFLRLWFKHSSLFKQQALSIPTIDRCWLVLCIKHAHPRASRLTLPGWKDAAFDGVCAPWLNRN
jgi:hypothetical protein